MKNSIMQRVEQMVKDPRFRERFSGLAASLHWCRQDEPVSSAQVKLLVRLRLGPQWRREARRNLRRAA